MSDSKNINKMKEIRISCDFETDTALVRIFKYRNYVWSGGKVYELERDCDRLKELGAIVMKYRDQKFENRIWSDQSILWNGTSLTAVGYTVWIGDDNSKPKHDSNYYLGRD